MNRQTAQMIATQNGLGSVDFESKVPQKSQSGKPMTVGYIYNQEGHRELFCKAHSGDPGFFILCNSYRELKLKPEVPVADPANASVGLGNAPIAAWKNPKLRLVSALQDKIRECENVLGDIGQGGETRAQIRAHVGGQLEAYREALHLAQAILPNA